MSDTLPIRRVIYDEILNTKGTQRYKHQIHDYESLLTVLITFYDTICTDKAKKESKVISKFANKYGGSIEAIRSLCIKRSDFNFILNIAKGYFGQVHVVREITTGNIYAMKVLEKNSTLSQESAAFYQEERDIMALCDSPWLTSLQYAFQDNFNLYMVMEYHPGGDLHTLLLNTSRGYFEEDVARFYLSEILCAVHSLHLMGYLHRDLKPENILIDRTGHIKLADFGSAIQMDSNNTAIFNVPVGTTKFISPEVLTCMERKNRRMGCECDWWSVGVMAYELMIGSSPFDSESTSELYSLIIDFEATLNFPAVPKLSHSAINLINGLLTGSDKRLSYNELIEHEFFRTINFNQLRNLNAPILPEMKDLSNIAPLQEKLITKPPTRPNGGLGRSLTLLESTLPFLYFNFTRDSYFSPSSTRQSPSFTDNNGGTKNHNPLSLDSDNTEVMFVPRVSVKNVQGEASQQLLTVNQSCEIKKENDVILELKEKIKDLGKQIQELKCANNKNECKYEKENSELQKLVHQLNLKLEAGNEALKVIQEQKLVCDTVIQKLESDVKILQKKCVDSESYWNEFCLSQKLHKKQIKYSIDLSHNFKAKIESLNMKVYDLESERNKIEDDLRNLKVKSGSLDTQENAIDCKSISTSITTTESPVITGQESQISDEINTPIVEVCVNKLSESYISGVSPSREQQKDVKMTCLDPLNECEATVDRSSPTCVDHLFDKQEDSQKSIKDAIILSLNNSFCNVEGELQKCFKRIGDLEMRIYAIQEQTTAMGEQANQLMSLRNFTNMCCTELRDQLHAAREKINVIGSNMKHLTMELERKDLDVHSLQSKITSLEKSLNNSLGGRGGGGDAFKQSSDDDVSLLNALVNEQKTLNSSLNKELEKSMLRIKYLCLENERIKTEMQELNFVHKERVIRLETTISQQLKLIDLLRTENKKKKMAKSRLDVEKEAKDPPHSDTQKFLRACQQSLELEKMNSFRLSTKVAALQRELHYYKACNNIDGSHRSVDTLTYACISTSREGSCAAELVTSPFRSSLDSIVSPGVDHKVQGFVPEVCHQFKVDPCMLPSICPSCFVPISFGKFISMCEGCGIVCHATCETSLPPFSCCVYERRKNLAEMISYQHLGLLFPDALIPKPIIPYSGCLSIPRRLNGDRYEWEKRWFVLSCTSIDIRISMPEDSDDGMTTTESIDLTKVGYGCVVHPAIHTSDVLFVSPPINSGMALGLEIPVLSYTDGGGLDVPTDLSKIMPLHGSNGAQTSIIYMLAESLDEKRSWVMALEEVISGWNDADTNKQPKPVATLDTKKLQNIRSLVALNENLLILGSSDGVFSYSLTDGYLFNCCPCYNNCHLLSYHCEALFSILDQKKSLARLYSEKHRVLSRMPSKNCHLRAAFISDISDCYSIGSVSIDQISGAYSLAVSRPSEILIIKINPDFSCSKLHRIPCYRPASSVICKNNLVYFCHEKFYVCNLETNEKREFLDHSDEHTSSIFANHSASNSPLVMFEIRSSSVVDPAKKSLFLLCFSECGIIVDASGHVALPKTIRWDQIPVSFLFLRDNLYVGYSHMVQVFSFHEEDGMMHVSAPQSLSMRYLPWLRIVGASFDNDGIYVSGVTADLMIHIYEYSSRLEYRYRSATSYMVGSPLVGSRSVTAKSTKSISGTPFNLKDVNKNLKR